MKLIAPFNFSAPGQMRNKGGSGGGGYFPRGGGWVIPSLTYQSGQVKVTVGELAYEIYTAGFGAKFIFDVT